MRDMLMPWRNSELFQYEYRLIEKELQDWFQENQSIPDRLYHYTDLGGLKGIVENESLWATHSSFLNDSSELQHAQAVLKACVAEREKGENNEDQQELLKRVSAEVSPFNGGSTFYFISFCVEGNVLSQWRGYGDQGYGCAIGFKGDELARKFEVARGGKNTRLRKVIYDEDQQREQVSRILDLTLGVFDSAAMQTLDAEKRWQEIECAVDFVQHNMWDCYVSFKHAGFSEEREWRLVLPKWGIFDHHKPEKDPGLLFRQRGRLIISYQELKTNPMAGESDVKLPIEEIILGPRFHGQESINFFLKAKNVGPIRLTKSAIPFQSFQ